MNIIICGAGQVGFNLARYLADHNNHVTVIDSSEDLITRINERLDVRAVIGQASFPAILSHAGAANADMLIAVTQSDEVNMTICQVANALFQIKTKIARVRNQSYLDPRWGRLFDPQNLNIDYIISPEVELALAIHQSLTVPGAFNVIPLADEKMKIIAVRARANVPIVNTPISYINGLFPDLEISIIGIVRGEDNFVPKGDDTILEGDEVYFIVESEKIEIAMTAFGLAESEAKRVVILGAGNVGVRLAEEIEKNFHNVRVQMIEKDQARAEFAAEYLKDTLVLKGDCLDQEILLEAGMKGTQTVVALTQDDRVNALASVLAKKLGAERTLALINNSSYGALITSLNIDAIINPRALTVSRILAKIYCGHVHSVYSLSSKLGEVIEAEVDGSSQLVSLKVEQIDCDGEIKVAGLMRQDQVMIAHSNLKIQSKDRIIVMTSPKARARIDKLFTKQLKYF